MADLQRSELRELEGLVKAELERRGRSVETVNLAPLASGEVKAVIVTKGKEPNEYGGFTVDQIRSFGQ